MISQRRWLTPNTQSILGSILVLLGILLLFPPSSLSLLYSNSLYTGYLAISLIGMGDPLVITITIRNMEEIQSHVSHQHLTPHTRSRITSCWLLAWISGETAGKFLAGFFLDVMTIQQGAWIISAAGVVGAVIFGLLRMVERDRQAAKTVHTGQFVGNIIYA